MLQGICSIAYEITDDWLIESSSYWNKTRTLLYITLGGEKYASSQKAETCQRHVDA